MALKFIIRGSQPQPVIEAKMPSTASRKSGHSKALSTANIDLEQPGRLRTGHLMTLFSVSHSTLYNRIRAGTLPKPDGTDGTRPYWNTQTIRQTLQK
jgi:predicted DNA-binding transcriptional regulator AlpA